MDPTSTAKQMAEKFIKIIDWKLSEDKSQNFAAKSAKYWSSVAFIKVNIKILQSNQGI